MGLSRETVQGFIAGDKKAMKKFAGEFMSQ